MCLYLCPLDEIRRNSEDNNTIETLCHKPSEPLYGIMLENYNNTKCEMKKRMSNRGPFHICSCNAEECNDMLMFTIRQFPSSFLLLSNFVYPPYLCHWQQCFKIVTEICRLLSKVLQVDPADRPRWNLRNHVFSADLKKKLGIDLNMTKHKKEQISIYLLVDDSTIKLFKVSMTRFAFLSACFLSYCVRLFARFPTKNISYRNLSKQLF